MAADVDGLARALADLNVVGCIEFKLKQEQEVAVKSLLDGKDVLGVLPKGRFPVFQSQIGDKRFFRIIERFPNNDFPVRIQDQYLTERLVCQKCHQCYNSSLEIGILSCLCCPASLVSGNPIEP